MRVRVPLYIILTDVAYYFIVGAHYYPRTSSFLSRLLPCLQSAFRLCLDHPTCIFFTTHLMIEWFTNLLSAIVVREPPDHLVGFLLRRIPHLHPTDTHPIGNLKYGTQTLDRLIRNRRHG